MRKTFVKPFFSSCCTSRLLKFDLNDDRKERRCTWWVKHMEPENTSSCEWQSWCVNHGNKMQRKQRVNLETNNASVCLILVHSSGLMHSGFCFPLFWLMCYNFSKLCHFFLLWDSQSVHCMFFPLCWDEQLHSKMHLKLKTDAMDFRKHFSFQRHRGDQQIELSLKNKGGVLLCMTVHNNRVLNCWRSRHSDWFTRFHPVAFFDLERSTIWQKKKNS